MVSRKKIVTTVIILLLLSVLFSGCTGEKNIAPAPESIQKEVVDISSQNSTQSPKEENMPEIKITSFSSIYMHDKKSYDPMAKRENGNVYKKMYRYKYEPYMRYYAVYDLSIRNNGSSPLYFNLNGLCLHEGARIFNTTALEPYGNPYHLQVLRDLEKENKLQDTTLLPGQILNGIVAFRVNSLYDESFLLTYNATPVTSASFEKSIEALRAAEFFNYSVALGKPPYRTCHFSEGSYEPLFDDYCETWANWMNRSIFETFQKYDMERLRNSSPYDLPMAEMVYALRVIPDRNITMFPIINQSYFYLFNWDEIPGNDSGILLEYLDQKYGIDGIKTAIIEKIDDGNTIILSVEEINLSLSLKHEKTRVSFGIDDGINYEFIARTENDKLNIYRSVFNESPPLVIEDTGEELINTSDIAGMAVMSNQTYIYRSAGKLNFPGMSISNASVVQISFKSYFGWPVFARFNYAEQDVILDKDLNIIVVRYCPVIFIS